MTGAPTDDAKTAWRRWLLGPTLTDRMFLYEELAAMTGAGFGVRDAVRDLAGRAGGRRRAALDGLGAELDRGATTGEAMARLPECFAPVEAHLVAAGDRTGRFDRAFRDAVAEVERTRQTSAKVLRAVAYPLFLLHFALFVPGCVLLSNASGMRAAQWTVGTVFVLFWAAVLAALTWHVDRRKSPGWGRAIATIPLFGAAGRSAALARSSRVAAALYDAGADLDRTFEGAADASGNGWMAEDLRAAAASVRRGVSATEALRGVGAYGSDAQSLLETGEKSGTLGESFLKIAMIEEQRFDTALRRIAVALGAGLMLAVGVAVLWMAVRTFSQAYGL